MSQLESQFLIDCDLFEFYYEEDIKFLIEQFNSKFPDIKLKLFRRWKILFPYQIIYNLMFELINEIKQYIIQILNTNNNNDIKTLIFTGGASVNPIMKQMIEEDEAFSSLNFVQSHNPEVAISYGSVLFYLDHNIIIQRKAKYTFGIKVRKTWDDKEHNKGGIKVFDNMEKFYKCTNLFSKFITINEDIRTDKEITNSYKMTDSKVTIELYKTEKNNATFCDEKDEFGKLTIYKFGEFIIDVGNSFDIKERDALVKMKIGGTFILATAIYCKTGKESKIICSF